nr:MAG TPA: hypothetical protein [Caudoviricetes sp.]DAS96169.1 MAG TPA: hypothetical protein [Caudoviricetes sp.]
MFYCVKFVLIVIVAPFYEVVYLMRYSYGTI